jgi:hypothetical protein
MCKAADLRGSDFDFYSPEMQAPYLLAFAQSGN